MAARGAAIATGSLRQWRQFDTGIGRGRHLRDEVPACRTGRGGRGPQLRGDAIDSGVATTRDTPRGEDRAAVSDTTFVPQEDAGEAWLVQDSASAVAFGGSGGVTADPGGTPDYTVPACRAMVLHATR